MGKGVEMNDRRLSPHFGSWEWRCPCCGVLIFDEELIERLEGFRGKIGCPITITSGYRCPEHNAAVGGAEHSYHLLGQAADIRVEYMSLAKHYVRQYFKGVGFYNNHIHVDNRNYYAFWDKRS